MPEFRPSIGLTFGCDYNPEQWPDEVQAEDIELMAACGITMVSLGIFAWGAIEPSDDHYEFGWLERSMDRLHAAGIRVALSTPTANPPMWLYAGHPEVAYVDLNGVRMGPASRQAFCPSSPVVRQYGARIARKLAETFGAHPALALWHVSNEIGNHNARCTCSVSTAAFRLWLHERYGTIGQLNDAWGTAFWGQYYQDFDAIQPPRKTTTHRNPAHLLDFARFSSDAQRALYLNEADVLREVTPDVAVTTNFMLSEHISAIDYAPFAAEVDIVANDHYLIAADVQAWKELSFSADRTRGLAGGECWLLMEHSPSQVNWQPRNVAKLPGEMQRNTLAHIARGADGAMFFQWRQSMFGAERFHSALVPHAGIDTRLHREVRALGAAIQALAPVAGTIVERAGVAMVFDYEAWWSMQGEALPSVDVRYTEMPRAIHGALMESGVQVDVVPSNSDLSGYAAVIVPNLFLASDASIANILAAHESGAHLLVTYLSGTVDEREHVRLGGYPGGFATALGVRVEEFLPLRDRDSLTLDDGSAVTVWSERVGVASAEVLARYRGPGIEGSPAITKHRRPDGSTAWYLSAHLDDAALRDLLLDFAATAGISAVAVSDSPMLERVRRVGLDHSYLFTINHGPTAAWCTATGTDLLTGDGFTGRVMVPAGGVRVIEEAS